MKSSVSMCNKVLLGALLVFVTWATPCSRVVAAPTSAGTGVTSTENRQASAEDRKKQPPRCNYLDQYYFQSLPGLVANCYASRKWKQGHYQAGIERFKLAAGWGSKKAQYSLGLIYFTGRHVATNKPLGLAWLKLAAERDDPDKVRVAKSAAHLASAEQKRQARRLLSHMRQRYGDEVAAKRAWKHYQHFRRYNEMAKMTTVVPACQNLAPSTNADQSAANMAAEVRCRQEEATARRVAKQKKTLAAQYFGGWAGTVTVRPVQTVPAPSATTSGD